MLRLHYHEQMRLAAEEDRCDLTVGQLRERLVHAGKPIAGLSTRALGQAVRKLARHSLVGVVRGFEADDDAVIEVKPLVEKVLPELVNTDNKGYKSVAYANVVPVLVEAVKTLKAQKDADTKALKAENAEIKAELEALKSVVRQWQAQQNRH
jgi:hypothetical protein